MRSNGIRVFFNFPQCDLDAVFCLFACSTDSFRYLEFQFAIENTLCSRVNRCPLSSEVVERFPRWCMRLDGDSPCKVVVCRISWGWTQWRLPRARGGLDNCSGKFWLYFGMFQFPVLRPSAMHGTVVQVRVLLEVHAVHLISLSNPSHMEHCFMSMAQISAWCSSST